MRLLLALLIALPLAASAEGRRMLGAHEQRHWTGVGVLYFGDASCTGALVAADLVVTAAHCLHSPRTGRIRPKSSIRFVAGYRMRDHRGLGEAAELAIHPRYAYGDKTEEVGIGSDIALVKLTEKMEEPTPFRMTSGLRRGDAVSIVSYGRDRPEIASIQSPCGVVAVASAIAVLDCDVTYGVSGAPVFVERDGEWRIVAIVSAFGEFRGERHSFAVVLDRAMTELLATP